MQNIHKRLDKLSEKLSGNGAWIPIFCSDEETGEPTIKECFFKGMKCTPKQKVEHLEHAQMLLRVITTPGKNRNIEDYE